MFKFKKSTKRIKEAGVVKFYHNRKVLADDVGSIGEFVSQAKKEVVYVGCWLSSSLKQDFLQKLNLEWNNVSNHTYENCKNCKAMPLCKGGCKIYDFKDFQKNHCDKCYVYADSFDAILSALAKIYLK